MAERRAGLGRGLGELFQRTDLDAVSHPVDQHVIVDKLGRSAQRVAEASDPSRSGAAVRDTNEVDVPRETPAEGVDPVLKTSAGATGTAVVTLPRSVDVSRGTPGEARDQALIPSDDASPEASVLMGGVGDPADQDELSGASLRERADSGTDHPTVDPSNGSYAEIPIDLIHPNAKQPRSAFEEDALEELVGSIREVGLLQPIVVRSDGQGAYELVMGERRWRASRLAGLETVPSIVRATADDDMLRDALLENIHRVQLNPLEEAAAYQQLMGDFGCTQHELAQRIKRSRSQIANTVRLLNLPPTVQRRVAAGVLSAGHARALLGLPDVLDQERLAQRIVAEGLSVRATEEIVALGGQDRPKPRPRNPRGGDPRLQELSSELGDYFDTRVEVTRGRNKGKIVVEFASQDDLDRIISLLRR